MDSTNNLNVICEIFLSAEQFRAVPAFGFMIMNSEQQALEIKAHKFNDRLIVRAIFIWNDY